MRRAKRARDTAIVIGVLVDGIEATIELVTEPGPDTAKLTADQRTGGQTYFTFRPAPWLREILCERVEGYNPRNPIWLHRAVVALAGQVIPPGHEIHHRNHNHLDNRADNLTVISADEHQAHHDKYPRTTEASQPSLFTRHLYVRAIDKRKKIENLSSVPRLARHSAHVEQMYDSGDLVTILESSNNGVPGVEITEPEYRRRILYSRQIATRGMSRAEAKRLRIVLVAIHRLGHEATTGRIIDSVAAKSISERTAYRALYALILRGFCYKQKRRYYLHEQAFVIEKTAN